MIRIRVTVFIVILVVCFVAIPANEIRKIFEERDVDIYGEKHN